RPTPEALVSYDGPGIDPPEEDSDDIGKCVPADGQGPDLNQDRVQGWKRQDEEWHGCKLDGPAVMPPQSPASQAAMGRSAREDLRAARPLLRARHGMPI